MSHNITVFFIDPTDNSRVEFESKYPPLGVGGWARSFKEMCTIYENKKCIKSAIYTVSSGTSKPLEYYPDCEFGGRPVNYIIIVTVNVTAYNEIIINITFPPKAENGDPLVYKNITYPFNPKLKIIDLSNDLIKTYSIKSANDHFITLPQVLIKDSQNRIIKNINKIIGNQKLNVTVTV